MFNLGNAERNLLGKKINENKYYLDNYEIDLNNINDSHAIIINKMENPKSVLDVGCGVGYIGKKIKELDKDCQIDGIELDKEAIKYANKIYDKVYNFSVEDYENEAYQKFFDINRKYDYIIFADLIEHLQNPEEIIISLSKKLNHNGKMIISIPNIAHVDIISGLIDGKFNYNNTGIIDSTHLRFFTKSSFYEFINNINEKNNINFKINRVGKTYAKNENNDQLLFDLLDNEIYVFQNIFELTIVDKKTNNKIKQDKTKNYQKINNNYLEFQEKIKEYEENIEKLNETVLNLNEKLTKSNMEMDAILSSKSWKLTKPIRFISSVFKNR